MKLYAVHLAQNQREKVGEVHPQFPENIPAELVNHKIL